MESLFSAAILVVIYLVVSGICYVLIPIGGQVYQEVLGFDPTTFFEAIEGLPTRRLRIPLRIIGLVIAPIFSALALVMFFVIGAIKFAWWLVRCAVKAFIA